MSKLTDLFEKRMLLVNLLMNTGAIKMNISKLIIVLEKLINLEKVTISECLL
jgi:hypothetical protein